MRRDFLLFTLAAPLATFGDLRHSGRRTHSGIAKRAEGSLQLHKRFTGTRWTYYDVGRAAYVTKQDTSKMLITNYGRTVALAANLTLLVNM